ncbi:non-ribosomal peptide synthetase [Nostoc sp. 'Lobaria pulmonaria (5183) cyanobiont']|uniref:non-ribosomal peptide synthetase n=1 Tax=Nostoc sp. 'Lobaria pulmonaria (5183) cyanobiont' TaxID=1618022 RepID=UPI001F34A014|nr:non-ribosomal peptide synthetase [Nostoc sp. 'Lobaria pulmonaria (5183) cyanobiont']
MNDFFQQIAALSPEQRVIFEKRLKQRGLNQLRRSEIPKIKVHSRKDSYNLPLSFAQQRLWFLAQLEPNSPFYNVPAAVRLQGELNFNALQQSFNEIVCRHEALRTNFQTVEGQAIAVISKAKPLILPKIDISELPLNRQEVEVRQQALQEVQTPFELTSDLLLRVKLLRLNEQEHIVLLTMHHIVSDGWSVGVLMQELAKLYPAFFNQQLSPLAELPIQYVDFAVWQREWLQAEVLQSQLSYWRKQLQGAPELLELPTDYLRPAIQTFWGANYSFELSKELSASLNKLSQQQGSTLFMTLLAAFQTLLWRYTGQEDIVVGSPIANRNRAEIEGLIGFFVNTLVLRTNLAGNPSFEELIKRVREVALGAYAHQDLPFELLVEQLQPQRDLSYTPLFQVMFVLHNFPMSVLELPGLTLTPIKSERKTAHFDLILSMTETESGLEGRLEYNIDLFEEKTITRMVDHWRRLLEAIVANPQQRLSEFQLLTESEQQQLLVEWNQTQVEYPQDKCIYELFEAQVKKTPDAVAVVFESKQLTYWELNARANQLAHYLQSLGVKPEVLIGICVERSVEMAVAILATLKAGGVYIPIDPNYPTQRITEISKDAGIEIILTQQHLEVLLEEQSRQLVALDSNRSEIAEQPTDNCHSQANSENLAYVIYTSGSTGKPKGVAVTHQALVNYALEIANQFKLQKSDRVLQFASIGFDVVVEELFPTWIKGATVVLPGTSKTLSCQEFQQLIEIEQLTVFELPTAYWHQWVSELYSVQETVPICVRLAIVGGERILGERLRQWQQLSTSLIHVYGLTETTVTSTLYHLNSDAELLEAATELPIGQPVANTEIYLLDSYLQPVPVGVPGEIYLGGAGLARGYLNRPELTAQRFIPNPFSQNAGARLYRTGDQARYLPDGNIEYIGRIDHQVKLRGFRIELGEIESILSQIPEVKECVVIDREDIPDQKRLVAYLVTEESQEFAIAQVRSFLKSQLPDYMIPSAFVELKTLPLTSNGKIDRKILPVPDWTRLEAEATFVPPQSPLEEAIAEIWVQLLNVNQIGINDNFFDLGGHSLIATQLVSRLRKAFQVELPLRYIFEFPTIAELAVTIVQSQIEQMNNEEKVQFLAAMKDLSEEEIESMLAS